MIEADDFIHLPYTPELTQAGIAYATRALPLPPSASQPGEQRRIPTARRLQQLVAGVAVELALRRYLNQENIPYDVLGSMPFSEPDKFELSFGGRRVDVRTNLVTERSRIRQLRRSPQVLVGARARLPVEQLELDGLGMHDVYIFTYLAALVTQTLPHLEKAIAAGQPTYLIHSLPPRWAQPQTWQPLGRLALKCDTSHTLAVEVGGRDEGGKLLGEKIVLQPRTRTELEPPFYSLTYLHAPALPDGQVGLYSAALGKPYLVSPRDWTNIWVYGLEVVLTGYISRREFRDKAERLPLKDSSAETRLRGGDELAMPVSELRPLAELFDQARRWAARAGR
jgi:hypothetical protein